MRKDEEDKFDEFGNYIGSLSEGESGSENSFELEERHSADDIPEPEMQIIERAPLHEEKQYYPELAVAYPNAETMVQEEDLQDLDQPIIQAPKPNDFYVKYNFESDPQIREFVFGLQKNLRDVRNLALIGDYKSGKTKFADILIRTQTMTQFTAPSKKFTSDSMFEKERKITINVKPFSFPLSDRKGKHYLWNVLDTPGHPDFFDEVKCALEIVDGVILMVDVIEGVTQHLKRLIEEIKYFDLQSVVVINKIDRLIVEAKLPPEDAYLKIKLVVDELNELMDVSPAKGDIYFASTRYRFFFGIDFFARKSLSQLIKPGISIDKLLWGNIYYDFDKREFTKSSKNKSVRRTFVDFVLDPVYKIFSHIVAKEKEALRQFLFKMGLEVKNKLVEEISLKELLQNVLGNFLCDVPSFVQRVSEVLPDAEAGNKKIIKRVSGFENRFTGESSDEVLALITKVYPEMPPLDDPPKSFSAFGRVLHGVISRNTKLNITDAKNREVFPIIKNRIHFPHCAHLKFETTEATQGSFVYFEGIGNQISKQGWIFRSSQQNPKLRLRELALGSKVKVALEPLQPGNLQVVLENLSFLSKLFPGLKVKTEESGELVIFGRGELFMDTVLNFLRNFFAKCEIRLSEPSCAFAESGIVTSQMFGRARTENRKNVLEFITEPLEKEISSNYLKLKSLEQDEIEQQDAHITDSQVHDGSTIPVNMIIDDSDNSNLRGCLVNTFKWDRLAAKTLWCFGPSHEHPCLLIDDSFADSTTKSLLYDLKPQIVNGFNWAMREGPLCEEPLREMKVKLTNSVIDSNPRNRTGEQFVAITRKAIHTAMLLATPRLMEPLYDFEILCTQDALQTIYTTLARRRGQLTHEKPKPGTIYYEVVGRVPILESFGFETDLKLQTLGQATVSMGFGGWDLLPGDPLDKDVKLTLLEPAEPNSLARDVMIKTRRRKGLSDDISIVKYFDDENILNAIKNSFLV